MAYAAQREVLSEVNLFRRTLFVFMNSVCIKPDENYKKKNKDFAFFSESVFSVAIQSIFLPPKTYCSVGFPPQLIQTQRHLGR